MKVRTIRCGHCGEIRPNAGNNLCDPCYRADRNMKLNNGLWEPSEPFRQAAARAVELYDKGGTVYTIAQDMQRTVKTVRGYLKWGLKDRPTLDDLVAIRKRNRIPQAEIAEHMGISVPAVSRMENRDRHHATTTDRYRRALLLILNEHARAFNEGFYALNDPATTSPDAHPRSA